MQSGKRHCQHQVVNTLRPYEQKRLQELNTWLQRPPGWISRGLDRVSSPAVRALQAVVPPQAISRALTGSSRLGERLANEKSILRLAKAVDIEQLGDRPLESCDRLARQVARRSALLAGSGGAVTGVAGAFGSALDIPALITLSLRSIHRTALCYGERATEGDTALIVLALASANQQQERLNAMAALLDAQARLALGAALEALEVAAHREIAKQSVSASLTTLSHRLGLNLGRRKAAGAVPVLGALIGGTVNSWFVHDVCVSAQFGFVARRLALQGHLPDAIALIPLPEIPPV